MQSTIQMPLVHVMSNVPNTGSNANAMTASGGEQFNAKLNALLTQAQAANPSGTMSTEQALLAKQYMQVLHGIMLEEELDIEQLLPEFLSLLLDGSEDEQDHILSQHMLQQWLQDAVNLLQTAGYSLDGMLQETAGKANSQFLRFDAQFQSMPQHMNLAQAQQVMQSFLALVQQQGAHNPMLQEHALALQALLKPLMTSMQQVQQDMTTDQFHASTPNNSHITLAAEQSKLMPLLQQMQVNSRVSFNQSQGSAQGQHPELSTPLPTMTLVEDELSTINQRMATLVQTTMQSEGMSAGAGTILAGEQSNLEQLNNQSHAQAQALPQDVGRTMGSSEHIAKSPPALVHAQHFAEQTSPLLIKQLQIAQLNGVSEARISLVPEHLGQVNIHITMKNGQMVAQFIAESAIGKEMLEGQLTQLRTVLQGQGIQVDKLEVLQGQQSDNLFQQPREQHNDGHQKTLSKNKKPDYDAINDDFSLDFRDDTTHQSRLYGSSFEAVI